MLDLGSSSPGPVVVLTGAGISADSGVPTFRGEEGYWTVGSKNYHPMELATQQAFREMPEEVWRWYLYRRSVCRRAKPNAAHEALVRLEHALGHLRVDAGASVEDLHQRALRLRADAEDHTLAGRARVERVLHEVDEDLTHLSRVAPQRHRRIQVRLDADRPLRRERLVQARHVAGQRAELHLLHRQGHERAGEVEQLLEDLLVHAQIRAEGDDPEILLLAQPMQANG